MKRINRWMKQRTPRRFALYCIHLSLRGGGCRSWGAQSFANILEHNRVSCTRVGHHILVRGATKMEVPSKKSESG